MYVLLCFCRMIGLLLHFIDCFVFIKSCESYHYEAGLLLLQLPDHLCSFFLVGVIAVAPSYFSVEWLNCLNTSLIFRIYKVLELYHCEARLLLSQSHDYIFIVFFLVQLIADAPSFNQLLCSGKSQNNALYFDHILCSSNSIFYIAMNLLCSSSF